ncbi:MAG: hypothetical protein ACKVY0_00785 [Prosthecobacter sp.]|uniref:hypothetical protein n=1 Tax=Prosthecobacter sp. TaxID=1965333 RepID=UPI0038FECAAA
MTSTRHFALSFFGPILMGAIYCGLVYQIWDWLDHQRIPPLVAMLVGSVVVAMATRWFVRNFIPVRCIFCGGKSYEIPDRGNRFMCRVCAKDH